MAPGSPPSRWLDNPPASAGRKVIITDTDHYAPGQGDALWAWKSFLRGHHPILMDFGLIGGVNPPDPSAGTPSYAACEPARYAMRPRSPQRACRAWPCRRPWQPRSGSPNSDPLRLYAAAHCVW